MNIFISHSSSEAKVAKEICNELENNGKKCFLAPRDIRSGYEYAEEIANGIDSSNAVLLVLSNASNNSPHVLREVERAVTKRIPILVYKLEEVELTKSMEYFLMTHQWIPARKGDYSDVIRCVNNLENSDRVIAPVSIPQKKSKKPLFIALAGIVAFVLVIAVAMALFLNSGDNNEDETPYVAEKNNTTTASQNQDVTDDNNENSTQTATKGPTQSNGVTLGDTLTIGNYNGEAISWRVIKINADGSAVVVARDVLTMKAFDAPDSGTYNHDGTTNYMFNMSALENDGEKQAFVQGNSSWANSNIRTWLNSDKENVKYEGQAPVASAMADLKNGYHQEKGFLCSFSDEELAMIKTSSVVTKTNALSQDETITTEDKVFLLSLDELKWFEDADVSMLAVPTQSAIDKNQTFWYKDYCVDMGVETMMWWLREPVTDRGSRCYLVGNGYREENIFTWEVGVESFGIRPAMTIDLKKYTSQ